MPSQTISPISPRPRLNAFAQYLMVLASVILAYSAYVQFAVPAIEGPPNLVKRQAVTPLDELPSPRDEKSHLIPLLPEDAWELTDCKTLLIDAGTILFKELDQRADGSLTVEPFTLISGLQTDSIRNANASDPKTPTVLRCESGASLKFNKPIQEVLNGGAKLVSARLPGQVDIYRPPSQPNKNDALHVITSNVQVDKRRIYTLEEVQFSFGLSQGSGRNMLIDLDHEAGSSIASDFSSVKGIRRLELAFLDKLRIESSQSIDATAGASGAAVGPAGSQPDLTDSKLFSNNKIPIEVSCQGPFVFDFRSKTASFEDQVVAQQVDAFKDRINCEKLTLMFVDKQKQRDSSGLLPGRSVGNAEQAEKDFSTNLELDRFVAEGLPAVVVSRSRSAKISAEYLSYDVINNQIIGRCAPDSKELVTVVSPEYQMVAKQLNYNIPADGSMGEITATGAGRFLRVGTPEQDEFFATWQNNLTTRDIAEQPGLQRIIVDGNAKIRIASDTRVDADRLEILVWQTLTSDSGVADSAKSKWSYQPSKLVTTGNVTIVSPKLDGFTQHLTATWPDPQNRIPASQPQLYRTGFRGLIPLQSDRPGNQPASSRSATEFSVQATATRQFDSRQPSAFVEQTFVRAPIRRLPGAQASQAEAAKKTPQRKLNFQGNSVDIRLVGSGDNLEIRDLTVVGDVRIVSQPIVSASSGISDTQPDQPLTVTGHRLQLTPQPGDGNFRTLISGRNDDEATVTAKDFILKGQNINLDQVANKVWVEGAGSIKLQITPEESKPERLISGEFDSARQMSIEDLNVSWEGGMIFDGAKIYFEQNIVMSATRPDKSGNRSNIQSQSEGLSIELTQPLKFQQLQSNQKLVDAKIRELIFVEHVPETKQIFKLANHTPSTSAGRAAETPRAKRPVVIENRTFDADGNPLERQKFVVPQAVINAENGSVKSHGPGTIATHRLSKSTSDPSAPKSANPFDRIGRKPGNNQADSGISFIQINFDGDLSIDANRDEMILDRNIRTVYSPVQNWDKTFDPDLPHQRVPGTVFLTCERLQLAQWASRSSDKKSNEMIATGNAHVLSDSLEATADRISYSQASDILMIVGTSRNDANLWLDGNKLVAEKFTYQIGGKQRMTTQGVKNAKFQQK